MKGTILILILVGLLGCSPEKRETTPSKPIVFTSIIPQAGLVKAIVGDQIEVVALVGEGQSPHTYEPTARQLTKLGSAQALFTLGVPFEQALLKKIRLLYPELPIIGTQAGIQPRILPHAHHDETCQHAHAETDPHIWLSPLNALAIAENMLQTLEQIDPEHAALYRQNMDALANELNQIDTELRTRLAPYKGSRFYVFHPSFGYFADTYGLEEVSIELDGKSPSPRQLAQLNEQAKSEGVKVIFVQKQFPADSAKAIADALDCTVLQLDPLAEDVVANLHKIADSLMLALEK